MQVHVFGNSNSYAYLNHGIVLRNLGETKSALAQIEKAIELKPNNPLSYLNKGLIYRKLKNYKLAIDSYYKALNIQSDLPLINYELLTCKGLICDWHNIENFNNSRINGGLKGESVNPLDFFYMTIIL